MDLGIGRYRVNATKRTKAARTKAAITKLIAVAILGAFGGTAPCMVVRRAA